MSVYQQAYEKWRSSRDQDTFFSRKQNSKLKLISGRLAARGWSRWVKSCGDRNKLMRKYQLRSPQIISLIKTITNLLSIWPFSPLPVLKLHCSFSPQSIILLEKSKLSKWECSLTARRGWELEQCPGWMYVREQCGRRASTLYMPDSARNKLITRGLRCTSTSLPGGIRRNCRQHCILPRIRE